MSHRDRVAVGLLSNHSSNPLLSMPPGMRQGNDHGSQYRSAIYPTSATHMEAALRSKEDYQKVSSSIAPGLWRLPLPGVAPTQLFSPGSGFCLYAFFFGNFCKPLGIEPLYSINVLNEILIIGPYAFLFKINT